jgi:hypothetical protein
MENISYDGIFKELLDEFPDKTVVEFINKLFERNHTHDSEVDRLETESHTHGKKRNSDKILRIGGVMYHTEIQSTPDSDIALRVFEYSYRVALQHGKTQDTDYLKLSFPRSVVFYLRTKGRTPKTITIELELPDGNTTTFDIPAKHLKDYTLQDLTHDSSLIFAPYYPMLYEGELSKEPQKLENLKNESIEIVDKIKTKADNGEIGRTTADLIVKGLEDILLNVMVKSNISQKEVNDTMEAVQQRYQLEPLNWREEGRIAGIAEGETRGEARGEAKMRKATLKLLAKGLSIADIQDVTGYDTDKIEEIRLSMQKS